MDKKILYSYDDQGELQQYSAFVKMNIRSGFEVSNVTKRDKIIESLNQLFLSSHIYPSSLLHSDKPLPTNRLYFQRKDICSALKGNSSIYKYSCSSSILNSMSIIDTRAKKYLKEIDTYNERLQKCLQHIISHLIFISNCEYSSTFVDVSEFLLNLKNICIYLLEEVFDGLIDIVFMIKQLEVSFQYDIETKNNRSILMLINELNDLEKRMKEMEVAILFKKISPDDYKEDVEMDEKMAAILNLPEEEMYKQLQSYLQEEIETQHEKALEEKNQTDADKETNTTNNNLLKNEDNVILICEDKDIPKLSVSMTVEFIEEELVKIDTIVNSV